MSPQLAQSGHARCQKSRGKIVFFCQRPLSRGTSPAAGQMGRDVPIRWRPWLRVSCRWGCLRWEAVMLSETTIAALESELRGELIEPSDAKYDAARKVYNAMIDRKPRLIARCADVADVIAAVKFSREHKLPVSVRGGGHNAA